MFRNYILRSANQRSIVGLCVSSSLWLWLAGLRSFSLLLQCTLVILLPVIGKRTIKHPPSAQRTVPLSTGEAEFYGAVRSVGQGLGHLAVLSDLGLTARPRVWTDSCATRLLLAQGKATLNVAVVYEAPAGSTRWPTQSFCPTGDSCWSFNELSGGGRHFVFLQKC